MRNLKFLSLTLFVALALTAVSASTASAASYTAASYPTTAEAESALGNGKFTTEAGTVECKTNWKKTISAIAQIVVIIITATECKAFGFVSATVNMNGCDFLLTEPKGAAPNFTAAADVSCPAGKVIEISAGTCKATVGSQGPLNSVAFTNQAGGDILVKAGVTGIAYTVVTDGFGCPFAGTGAKTGASMTHANAITLDAPVNIDIG
jgi:hypothetical protein